MKKGKCRQNREGGPEAFINSLLKNIIRRQVVQIALDKKVPAFDISRNSRSRYQIQI